jgi:capsular exopolysaccharide synthesis family protein
MKGAMDAGMTSMGKREYIQTQVQLLKSTPVIEGVIEKLNLMSTESFSSSIDPVQKLKNMTVVSPVRNTQLINISIERADAKEAQRILNAILYSYTDQNRARRQGVSVGGLEELRKQSDILRNKLAKSTDALQNFMVSNSMVSFEKSQNIIIGRLRDLSIALTKLQPQRMSLQASIEASDLALSSGKNITSLPCVIDAPIVKDLKLELSRLSNEYSQLIERLGENHPKLQSISTQIQSVQTKLAIESNSIINSIRLKYQQIQTEERLLSEAIKQQQQEVYRFNRLATEYDVLKREVTSIEGPYSTVSRRIEEIDINRMGGQGENIFIISKASLPKLKSWPSKSKNLMVAFILAGGLAVGLCFFLDYMDTTVKGESDVKRLLQSKVLAGIPDINQKGEKTSDSDLIVFENPRSHTAEAFRSLRTALTFSIPGERISSVVVSSALPSEGKSLAAINLAITQAQSNKRTVIIDADMRKPRLHKVFDASNIKGLSNLLSDNKCDIKNVVQKTKIENLDFIPCGPIPRNPAELLEADRCKIVIEKLHEEYDFIVFDSPPGFALVDSLIIGKYTDGLIMVVRSYSTPKIAAKQFATRLSEAEVRMLGVALNNVDTPHGGNGYGGYYYGKSSSKYYRDEEPSI